MNTEEFFAAPDYATREPARPKAVNPVTGREQSWTRASNHAAALDNPFGLIKSNLRKLVLGISRRPDLGRMLLAGAAIDDKTKADEIINSALTAAESEAKANEGTAAHAALARSWLGEPVAEEFHPLIRVFVKALDDNGLKPKAVEQTVLNTMFGVRGTLDWVFEEADGTEVIGEVKTGQHLDLAKRNFAVQLADYAGGNYLLRPDGTSEPTPWSLAPTHAVLIHIDLETLGVSVYRVDLHIGRLGAQLAEQVRQWHKLDPLTPYVSPLLRSDRSNSVGPAPHNNGAPTSVSREQAAETVPVEGVGAVYSSAHQQVFPSEAALAEASSAEPVYSASETAQAGREIVAEALDTAPSRFDELMKLDKAPLQMELKNRFGWTDNAHNRRWLARAIIALESGTTDPKAVVKYAAAKDDAEPEKPAVAPSQKTYDPAGLVLAAIGQMKTIDGIETLRNRRVAEHGDQGWTDEMAVAATARIAEIEEIERASAPSTMPSTAIVDRISTASGAAALAELWNEVTLGGTDVNRWTPAMQTAGEARMAALREMQAAAPNPWGA